MGNGEGERGGGGYASVRVRRAEKWEWGGGTESLVREPVPHRGRLVKLDGSFLAVFCAPLR